MIQRRLLSAGLLAAAGLSALPAPVLAQAHWPNRPVRLIVPYPAGGPVDQLARIIAPRLGEKLGQPIVIDNRTGASGTIGIDATVKADPDGYTFGFGAPGGITVLPHLRKLPYAVEGIHYVSLVARVPQVIAVNQKLNVNTLAELIALAKKEPGKIAYGSAGNATTPHLGAELLAQEANVKMLHVAYKGAAPAVTALLAGEVQLMTADLSALLPYQSRGIRIIAVSGPQRVDVLPGVPTTTELGLPAVHVESNYGLIEPAHVAPATSKKLREALVAVLELPAVKAQIAAQGALAMSSTPEEYRQLMQQESQKWAGVLKKGNITLE